ncbi:hypothetical protein AVEN_221946-1 [Araneus ventricosus]|uniref:Uncharacterized protein n=1 Tax=Araneus ventricosus TaxID=182803 RepID=A0A4Y2F8W9_ARAVE|nr:hypothetical protein AVEN_221946-1 [Araneus ventricosus]
MLHTNELPLRYLILEMDGCTKPLDLKDIKKLSTDQQYLYRICLAINDGSCSFSVTENNPGKLSHARWLIPANCLLRLYIGTPSPSQNLIILVKKSYNQDKEKPDFLMSLDETRLFDVSSWKQELGKIFNFDTKKTTKLKTRIKRKSNTSKRDVCKLILAVRDDTDLLDEIQPSCSADLGTDDEYKPIYSEKKFSGQMRIKVKAITLNIHRYGVSDYTAAAIASSVLQCTSRAME